MLYPAPPPEIVQSPAARDFLTAVARDVPSLGHALAEAILGHAAEIAALAYSGRYEDAWAYGERLGWDTDTTATIARHALTILFPVALRTSQDDPATEDGP